MRCPVCFADLQQVVEGCLVCPKGDGVVLTSVQLLKRDPVIITKVDVVDKEIELANYRVESYACPGCGELMHLVDYCGTGVKIDSCVKPGCLLRWLDGDELAKIAKYKKDPNRPEEFPFGEVRENPSWDNILHTRFDSGGHAYSI